MNGSTSTSTTSAAQHPQCSSDEAKSSDGGSSPNRKFISVFDQEEYVAKANTGIEIKPVDDHVGKGVFATRSYKSGEEVLADLPIVTSQFAWNKLYNYKACDYCMRALETTEENVRRLTQNATLELPYPECCDTKKELQVTCDDCPAAYCSKECKEKAYAEYHRILCYHSDTPPTNVNRLEEYWRSMHYPPETGTITLLVRILAKLHLDETGTLSQRIQEFCQASKNENEELAHKILGDEYVVQVGTLRELVTSVINFPNIEQWLSLEGFLQLFILIGRNSQGVGTSAFATYVSRIEQLPLDPSDAAAILLTIDNIYEVMDKVVGHFLDNEGVALYPLQSWANHSCVPNCEVKFPERNHRLGLIATKDIEAGEEIKISYLDLADLSRSRYSRNKYLKEHYLFECQCPKCMEQIDDEEGTTDSEEDMDDEDEDDDEELVDADEMID